MKAPISLTFDELLAVLERARDRRLRDWVILLTLYWHGFRVSEVVNSSTKQLGLFFSREKAEGRQAEAGANATVKEVQRRVSGKLRTCYLVTSDRALEKPGLTFGAIEGQELTVQRLKRSLKTVQQLQEHENPLLNEKLAWEEWLAERARRGKKGGAKMQQKDILLHSGPEDPVFGISRSQVFRIYQRHARAAGLPRRKCHPHCLKHTCAATFVDLGATLPDIQVRLGHASLSSTGKYTLPREDDVSRRLDRLARGNPAFRQQATLFGNEPR